MSESQPQFAHLPLLLKPQGKGKLSKRDGAQFGIPVFPMEWKERYKAEVFQGFRENGFLPEALLNFLLLLGWNPGTEQEFFSQNEMVAAFSFDKIGKAGARFDYKKALWFNSKYIQKTPKEELLPLVKAQFEQAAIKIESGKLNSIIDLFKPRVDTLHDFVSQSLFLFQPIQAFDEKNIRKKWKEGNKAVYLEVATALSHTSDNREANYKAIVERIIQTHEAKFGNILPLIRIAISGVGGGPDLFSIMEIIEKPLLNERLNAAVSIFDQFKIENNA